MPSSVIKVTSGKRSWRSRTCDSDTGGAGIVSLYQDPEGDFLSLLDALIELTKYGWAYGYDIRIGGMWRAMSWVLKYACSWHRLVWVNRGLFSCLLLLLIFIGFTFSNAVIGIYMLVCSTASLWRREKNTGSCFSPFPLFVLGSNFGH